MRCYFRACPYFKNRPGEDNTGKRCYALPHNPERRQKWIDWIDRANVANPIKGSKSTGVCSDHFTPDCYTLANPRKLKFDAIPTTAPEMTPELAFKLGIARSVEDFIRSKELGEDNVITEESPGNGEYPDDPLRITKSGFSAQDMHSAAQASTEDTYTTNIFVQACNPTQPMTTSTSDVPVQRIFVVPVVNKSQENIEIRDHDYSNLGTNDPQNPTKAPFVLYINAASADTRNTPASSLVDMPDVPNITTDLPPRIDTTLVNANTSNVAAIGEIEIQRLAIEPQRRTSTKQFKRKRRAYVRDLSPSDFNTPEKAAESFGLVNKRIKFYQGQMKMMTQSLRRARKKIEDLESLLDDKTQRKENNLAYPFLV